MAKFKGLELLREESDLRDEPILGANLSSPVAKTVVRPPGKRQNPAYHQISAYVRRDLYEQVRRDLIGQGKDFSDLLEQWMEQWLASRSG